ncbi:MAG: hypothetical protein WC655_05915 [Candidatus Hydrogenedentales bacterium]|jgi:hypothetical protein
MMLVVFLVFGGVCVGALGAADPVEGRTQYCIEAKIYRPDAKALVLPNGAPALAITDLKADVIDLNKDRAPGMTFFGNAEFTVGSVRVVVKKDSLTWNGEANPDPAIVPCLTSPKILTLPAQTAEVRVGEESIQYFERAPDGLFDLKTQQVFTGYAFTCTVTPGDDSQVKLKWGFKAHRVKERIPIPNVHLDIGLPVIEARNFDADVIVELGEWGCFAHTAKDEALLIFVRVTESEDEEG